MPQRVAKLDSMLLTHLETVGAKLPRPNPDYRPQTSDGGRKPNEIDDLYAFARPRLASIQQPVNVHFTAEGSNALAQQVVQHIRQALHVEGNR